MKRISVLLMVIVLVMSCEEKSTIDGLWIVQSVKFGEEEMTPNARWVRFNADLTQASGNGRFQHSYGTWKLEQSTNKLSIVNSNGLVDRDEPFTVTINQEAMTWNRMEEGQNVEISLERSSQLPETYGDKILGLWKLEKAIGNGNYFEETTDATINDYLFFRWDKRFTIRNKEGRINGVYNVHGHKPEVELIPYGKEVVRDFWEIQFEDNVINLKLLNVDTVVTRRFKRVHEFPN